MYYIKRKKKEPSVAKEAAKEGVQALMLANVVADMYHPERDSMTAEQKERGLDDMIIIGLETLLED